MKKIIIFFLLFPFPLLSQTHSIIFSEIAWMGTTNSSNDEWIEIQNLSSERLDLSGWKIEALDGQPVVDLEGIIEAQEFFLLERTDDDSVISQVADQIYTGSLGNSGETLFLKNHQGEIVDKVIATSSWLAGSNSSKQTMSRKNDFSWANSASQNGTPREENDYDFEDDSFEEEDLEQEDTGEGEEIDQAGIFPTPQIDAGTQYVSHNTARQEKNNTSFLLGTGSEKKSNLLLRITEILPNPKGIDGDGEWIELRNTSQERLFLEDWTIQDKGENKFSLKIIKEFLDSGEYLLLTRKETGIVLNNESEVVSLHYKDKLIHKIDYNKAPNGQSYACVKKKNSKADCAWQWTYELSPGQKISEKLANNKPEVDFDCPDKILVGSPVLFDSSDTFDPDGDLLEYSWDFGDFSKNILALPEHTFFSTGKFVVRLEVRDQFGSSSIEKTVEVLSKEKPKETDSYLLSGDKWQWSSVAAPSEKNVVKISTQKQSKTAQRQKDSRLADIREIKNQNDGEQVKVEGQVTALPGDLSSQFFYISGSSGIQVYSYKKSFPELSLGDKVRVQGELSSIQGEKRIKTKEQSDVVVLGQGRAEYSAKDMSCDKLNEEEVGDLISLQGTVTEQKGATAFLDDGSSEAKIYIKSSTGINSSSLEEGSEYKITGILGKTNSGLRLLPRREQDVEKISQKSDYDGMVLGSQEGKESLAFPSKNKTTLVNYLLVLLIAINALLVVYIYKLKNK